MKGTETLGFGRALKNFFKGIIENDENIITNIEDIPELEMHNNPEDIAMRQEIKRNTAAIVSGKSRKNNRAFASPTNGNRSRGSNINEKIMQATIINNER